jgi:hypothetical protein
MKHIFILLSLGFSLSAFSSALVKKDVDSKTLTVEARMVYSGNALTEELARLSTDEIQRMWNETPTEVVIDNETYSVVFEVDYVLGGGVLTQPDSCAYNFIQILTKVYPGDRSYYSSLGARTGVFYTSDDLGHSTTAAHEFGHGILLAHNPGNQILAPVPGIMFARGTLVRPEFQWNPLALPGQPGGTVNPIHRHVRSEDIKTIPFSALKFGLDGLSCLGNGMPLQIL